MQRAIRSWTELLGHGTIGLTLFTTLFATTMTAQVRNANYVESPSAFRHATSFYVKMRDNVELAVSLYLPRNLKSNERVPALMRTTRYWREPQKSRMLKTLINLHIVRSSSLTAPDVEYFNQRRFAVLLVDARGTGASGGHRAVEFSPAEVADMGELGAWAAAQPWCNGNVGTFGISYEGNIAELAAVPNQPAIRAVMPLYDTFDNTEDEGERGVALKSLLSDWFDVVV